MADTDRDLSAAVSGVCFASYSASAPLQQPLSAPGTVPHCRSLGAFGPRAETRRWPHVHGALHSVTP